MKADKDTRVARRTEWCGARRDMRGSVGVGVGAHGLGVGVRIVTGAAGKRCAKGNPRGNGTGVSVHALARMERARLARRPAHRTDSPTLRIEYVHEASQA
jgi:hypothetical protein